MAPIGLHQLNYAFQIVGDKKAISFSQDKGDHYFLFLGGPVDLAQRKLVVPGKTVKRFAETAPGRF